MTAELSRPFSLERLGEQAAVLVDSSEAERAAVARRLGLLAVRALTCGFDLRPGEPGEVLGTGRLRARVVQVCVVSLEPFEAGIDEAFQVRFVPEDRLSDALDLEAADELAYAGGTLDLGEAAAEQLALALDPFPRKPDALLAPEPERPRRNAFEVLSRLRPTIDRQSQSED